MITAQHWIEALRRAGYFGLPPREQVALTAKIRLIKHLRQRVGA